MAELVDDVIFDSNRTCISLARHVLRLTDAGLLKPHVGPSTALRALANLNQLVSHVPSVAKCILGEGLHPQKLSLQLWDNLFSLLGVQRGCKPLLASRSSPVFSQVLRLASVPVIVDSVGLLTQYVTLLAGVCQHLPTREALKQIQEASSTAPSDVAAVINATATPAPASRIASTSITPARQSSRAVTAPTSIVGTPMKIKAAAAPSIPTLDVTSVANLVAIQTSELLTADSFKLCLSVFSRLGVDAKNASLIANVLGSVIKLHAEALRRDLAGLHQEAVELQLERRASIGGNDVSDLLPEEAADDEEEEDEEVFEADVSAVPEAESSAVGLNSSAAQPKPDQIDSSAPRHGPQLAAFAVFGKAGCSQRTLLKAIQTAMSLQDILTVASLVEEANAESHDVASMGHLEARRLSSQAEVQPQMLVGVDASADAKPVIKLALKDLWVELSHSLAALSKLGKQTATTVVLKESIEAFLFCHKNLKATQVRASSTAHVGLVTHPATPSNVLSDEPQPSTSSATPLAVFSAFLELNKKTLNDLVRKSPTVLLSEPYSVLIQFPQILDFRIKEEYFRQSLKRQHQQQRYQRSSLHVSRFGRQITICYRSYI